MSDEVVKRALRDVARNGLQVELLMELLESVKLTPSEFQRARKALDVAAGKAYMHPPIVWSYAPSRIGGGYRRHAWRLHTATGKLLTCCGSVRTAHDPADVATEAGRPWTERDRRCEQCKSSIRSGRYAHAIRKENLVSLLG